MGLDGTDKFALDTFSFLELSLLLLKNGTRNDVVVVTIAIIIVAREMAFAISYC